MNQQELLHYNRTLRNRSDYLQLKHISKILDCYDLNEKELLLIDSELLKLEAQIIKSEEELKDDKPEDTAAAN
jgi:hypothetical protein